MTDATYDYTNPPLKLNQPPNLVSGRKKLKKLIQSILILALAMITISFNLSHKPESKPKFSTAQFFWLLDLRSDAQLIKSKSSDYQIESNRMYCRQAEQTAEKKTISNCLRDKRLQSIRSRRV